MKIKFLILVMLVSLPLLGQSGSSGSGKGSTSGSGISAGAGNGLPAPFELPNTPLTNAPAYSGFWAPYFSISSAAYNTPLIDPFTGSILTFATDPTHEPCGLGSGYSWSTTSYSGQWNISSDSLYEAINSQPSSSPVGVCIITYNDGSNQGLNLGATPTINQFGYQIGPINLLPTSYSFDRTHPHVLYGLSSKTGYYTEIQSVNLDYCITNGSLSGGVYSCPTGANADGTGSGSAYTKIVSLNDSTVFYSNSGNNPLPSYASTTLAVNWEVTVNAAGTRFAVWWNGAQNNAIFFSVYDSSIGTGIWFNGSTGDVNAAAGWIQGQSGGVQCAGCIPDGTNAVGHGYGTINERTGGTAHSYHRVSMDADGCSVWAENQSTSVNNNWEEIVNLCDPNGAGYPIGSTLWTAWGYNGATPTVSTFYHCSGPNDATSIGNASAYCANHHAFQIGGFAFNGQGLLSNGFGVRSWRYRETGAGGFYTGSSYAKGYPNATGGFPPGYSDLGSTFNIGTYPIGTGSHDSCGGTAGWPCQDAAYIETGNAITAVNYPWMQEVEIVSTNPSAQNVWRVTRHHLVAGFGSITTGGGVICNGSTCSVTTVGVHDFASLPVTGASCAGSGSVTLTVATNSNGAFNGGSTFLVQGVTTAANGTQTAVSGTTQSQIVYTLGSGTCAGFGTYGGSGGTINQNAITMYNCTIAAWSCPVSGIAATAVGSTTTFTFASSLTGTGDAEFVLDTSAYDFYATALTQLSPDGKWGTIVDNWERSFTVDTKRSSTSCNGYACPQVHILAFTL